MRTFSRTLKLVAVGVCLSVSSIGCSLFDREDDPRVNANGVDGVKFGDTKEIVREKLGDSEGGGIGAGCFGSFSSYETGLYAGLTLYFRNDTAIVDAFWMGPAYSGTTHGGIGIGSRRTDVLNEFGEPKDTRDPYVFYCLRRTQLELLIKGDTVAAFGVSKFPYKRGHCEIRC